MGKVFDYTITSLDWARQHPRDPTLVTDFAADRLPDLSVSNVRTMLRAAMPLPDLTADRAAARRPGGTTNGRTVLTS